MSADPHHCARAAGFRLLELPRIDGRRYMIVDQRGLVLRGSDEKPLSAEQVIEFLGRFDAPEWLL